MKNIFKTCIIVIFAFIMASCNKENHNKESHIDYSLNQNNLKIDFSNIYSDGRMLIFINVQDYVDFVNNLNEETMNGFLELLSEMTHTTYAEYLSTLSEEEILTIDYDEYLSQILNEDCIVQIGQYLYKVNTASEKVYVMHENDIEYYDYLVEENIEGVEIQVFYIGDDVIHIMEGDELLEKSCGGIGGGIYRCYDYPYQGQIIKTFDDKTVWRLNPYARFFRMGVYFRLSSGYEIWRYPTSGHTNSGQKLTGGISGEGITIEMFVKGPEGWRKRRPCNSNSIGTLQYGFHWSSSGGAPSKTVYSGSRNLNGYFFYVQGRAKYSDGSVTIASPYGGRNINSPY